MVSKERAPLIEHLGDCAGKFFRKRVHVVAIFAAKQRRQRRLNFHDYGGTVKRARKMNRDFMSEMISETYRSESIARERTIAHFVKGTSG